MSQLSIHDQLESPAKTAADALTRAIEEAGGPVLLLLSGGSSMEILEYLNPAVLAADLTITVLDERFSDDPEVSNFLQLSQTDFFQLAQINHCSFISPVANEGESLAECADRFESTLKQWHTNHPDGRSIATVGIGSDGHTAGVFPSDEATFNKRFCSESWVCGYELEADQHKHNQRITTTATFLTDVLDGAIVFATGSKKCETLKAINEADQPPYQQPGQLLHNVKASLFTDCDLS